MCDSETGRFSRKGSISSISSPRGEIMFSEFPNNVDESEAFEEIQTPDRQHFIEI